MEKNLIGWTIIVPGMHGDIRTYFKISQEEFMRSCLMIYVVEGKTVKVEPEFGTPRKVLY